MPTMETPVYNLNDAFAVAAKSTGVPDSLARAMLAVEFEIEVSHRGRVAEFDPTVPLPLDVPLPDILRGLTAAMRDLAAKHQHTGDWFSALAAQQCALRRTEPERAAYLRRVAEYAAYYDDAEHDGYAEFPPLSRESGAIRRQTPANGAAHN